VWQRRQSAAGCRHRLKLSHAMLKRGFERLSKSCTPGASDQQGPVRHWWRRAARPPRFHNSAFAEVASIPKLSAVGPPEILTAWPNIISVK
jgi:hypothetical protein